MKIRNFFLIVSLLGLFAQSAQPAPRSTQAAQSTILASEQVWRNHTKITSVYALAIQGNYLWAGTDGGVVR